jgi:adenosylmethionine---8-amino-7-oxononanoate aminotransferase
VPGAREPHRYVRDNHLRVSTQKDVDVAAATAATVRAGIWLRPFRDLIYTMPPYVTSDEDVTASCAGVLAAVAAVTTR